MRTTIYEPKSGFNGLTLDYDSQTLYWIDAAQIGSMSVDGSDFRVIIPDLGSSGGDAITFHNEMLYWNHFGGRGLFSCSPTASTQPPPITSIISSNVEVYDVQYYSEDRQPLGKQQNLVLW